MATPKFKKGLIKGCWYVSRNGAHCTVVNTEAEADAYVAREMQRIDDDAYRLQLARERTAEANRLGVR